MSNKFIQKLRQYYVDTQPQFMADLRIRHWPMHTKGSERGSVIDNQVEHQPLIKSIEHTLNDRVARACVDMIMGRVGKRSNT
jgi:hypothetical protein